MRALGHILGEVLLAAATIAVFVGLWLKS